jgi:hypothetical protein
MALASTGWMLSGLSPSPLLNGLLPALVILAGLLPLPPRRQFGSLLQLLALLGLLAVAGAVAVAGSGIKPQAAVLTLAASTLWAVGQACAMPALKSVLLTDAGLPPALLRSGSEIGGLAGRLFTGLLFPLGHALLQFSVAVALLLPQLPLQRLLRPGPEAPIQPDAPQPASAEAAFAGPPLEAPAAVAVPPATGLGHPAAFLVQGLLFGALFALMPLWVRRLEGGNCFDFGMVLSAYGLGRVLASGLSRPSAPVAGWGRLLPRLHYAAMALLLLLGQSLPGWLAVSLFVPFGLLASLSDQGLSAGVALVRQAAVIERSSALGRLLGSLAMGGLSQLVGLAWALPLLLGGFALVTLFPPGRRRPPAETAGAGVL